MPEAQLRRSKTDRMVAGVCGGLSDYLQIDPVLVRLAFVILLFASGIGVPIYLILWIVMPEADGESSTDRTETTETVTADRRLGRPITVGIALLLLGFYFLFSEFGWLNWISSGVFWPLVIIAFGAYLILRQRQ